MKRAGLAVAVVAAVVAAILFFARTGADNVAPANVIAPQLAEHAGAAQTAAHAAPRREHATESPPETKAAAAPTPGRIDGVVVEKQTDKPVAGAEILVSLRRTPMPRDGVLDMELPGEPQIRATSGADGKFVVDVPDVGPWCVVARAPGFIDDVIVALPGASLAFVLGHGLDVRLEIVGSPDGKPLAGAEVWVWGPEYKGPPQRRFVADEHGKARVRWLPGGGGETCVVRAKGYADRSSGAFFKDDKIWLAPGFGIGGFVRDRAGHGVAGALLHVQGSDPIGCVSGDDGGFALDGLRFDSGGRPMEAKADGFLPWTGMLEFGDTEALVVLSRAGAVVGTVLLPEGSPAVRAFVDGSVVTDASGAFRLTGLPPGDRTISATWTRPGAPAEEAALGVARCEIPDGGTVEGVAIRLQMRSFVVLRLLDDAGRPVTGYRAWIAGGDSIQALGEVASLGVVAPPGTRCDVVILGSKPKGRTWSDLLLTATTQASSAGTPIDVRLPPRKELTVEVLGPDGAGLPPSIQPNVALGEQWASDTVARVRMERSSVTWTVDPKQTYIVSVDAPGFAAVRHELTPDEIAAGRASLRLDPGATVRARVVSNDADTAKTASARLEPIAVNGDSGEYIDQPVRDPLGGIRFERVAPGRWRLVEGWLPFVTREFDVVSGVDVNLGDLPIAPRVVLRGVALRPDGRPCGGATVALCVDGYWTPVYASPVREDGSFAIDVPSDGRGALLVRKTGLGSAIARIDDSSKNAQVRLAVEGKVDLRIRLPRSRTTVAGWRVQTPDGSVRWKPEFETADATSGSEQRMILTGLGPGPLVVVADVLGRESVASVVVVAGETVTATLDATR